MKYAQKAVKKNAKKDAPEDVSKRKNTSTEENDKLLLSNADSKVIQSESILQQQLLQERIQEESRKNQRLQEELSLAKLAASASVATLSQSRNNSNIEPIQSVQNTIRALPVESPQQPLRCLLADSTAMILEGKAASSMITDSRNGKLFSLLMQSMIENAVSQERERYAVQQLQEQRRSSMQSEIVNLLSSFNK